MKVPTAQMTNVQLDSDEAPDVVDANPMVEYVAPADNPVAAAVENLLVVDRIVWTPSDTTGAS